MPTPTRKIHKLGSNIYPLLKAGSKVTGLLKLAGYPLPDWLLSTRELIDSVPDYLREQNETSQEQN
jgi:hypothetical protein